MGLDTTHDCWSGPYSQFMRWRTWLAAQAGIPLGLMEGFYGWTWDEDDVSFDRDYPRHTDDFNRKRMHYETLSAFAPLGKPMSWELFGDDPLVKLLHHSDCDGRIRWFDCKGIAIRLGQILRQVKNDSKNDLPKRGCYDGMVPATKRFIAGLLLAYRDKEDVLFR